MLMKIAWNMHIISSGVRTTVYVSSVTARFRLQECTRVQLHGYDTSIEIFVTCLHVHERLMTYGLPVQTLRTHACALARARNVFRNIYYMLLCARKIDEVCTYEFPVPS